MRQSLLTLALLLGGAALAQTTAPTPAPTTPAAPAQTAPAQTAPAQTTPAQTTTPTPAAPTQTSPAQTTPAAPATTPAAPARTAPAPAANPQAVVAVVGNERFTLADYEKAFRVAVARVLNSQGVPFTPDILPEFAEARGEFLKQYARDRAVYQLARRSTKVTPPQIDEQLAAARQGFKTDAEFAEALKATGYENEAELRADLERQTVVAAYLDAIKNRLQFSNALVASFYNLNKQAFTRPAQACVRHILVKTQAEAQTVLGDLQAGGDFAKIAQEKSQDPGSASEGGDLGCIAPGDTVEAFDKAAFSGPLNQPQITQTEYGWHVLLVTKRNQAGLAPLEEVAPTIREQLARDAAQKYLDSQLARLNIQTTPALVAAPAPATSTPTPNNTTGK